MRFRRKSVESGTTSSFSVSSSSSSSSRTSGARGLRYMGAT
eukprot:CAMPEP_0180397252 /NCGR_PEP_ID=MMETSP0989-20121125/35922_1 /TAXON_ID=697907 /ORGANISM="non described non described, Strain CCMP2293" /LENGTH=40 /DNA_ID= /DNA_START= /DNA_END= /DNA_ORIENTATION=